MRDEEDGVGMGAWKRCQEREHLEMSVGGADGRKWDPNEVSRRRPETRDQREQSESRANPDREHREQRMECTGASSGSERGFSGTTGNVARGESCTVLSPRQSSGVRGQRQS